MKHLHTDDDLKCQKHVLKTMNDLKENLIVDLFFSYWNAHTLTHMHVRVDIAYKNGMVYSIKILLSKAYGSQVT